MAQVKLNDDLYIISEYTSIWLNFFNEMVALNTYKPINFKSTFHFFLKSFTFYVFGPTIFL